MQKKIFAKKATSSVVWRILSLKLLYNGNQKLNILQQIKTNRKVLEAYISIGAKNNAPHLEHSLVLQISQWD